MDDFDEFLKTYDAYNDETTDDIIRRYSRTESEFRETIDHLIRRREMLRDAELEKLEAESDRLITALEELDREKLLEELRCFKEVLELHRRLVNGPARAP